MTLSTILVSLISIAYVACYFACFFFDWILGMKQIEQIDLTGMGKVNARGNLSFSGSMITVILHYQSSPTSSSQKSDSNLERKRIYLVIFQTKAGSNLIPVTP